MRSGWTRKALPVAVALLAESGVLALFGVSLMRRKRTDGAMQRLRRRAIQAAEDERRRIARELHDDIGQRLSLVSMQLSSLSRLRSEGAEAFREDLADAQRELDCVISDVHDLSHSLHSSKLQHLGLEASLRDVCQSVARRDGVEVELQAEGVPGELDAEVGLCFYRVAQEALSNVIKHSHSAKAEVRIACDESGLGMQVADFGMGFDAAAAPFGLGLGTMEERLSAIGGTLSIESVRGRGTTVTARAPVRQPLMPATQRELAI